MKMIAKFHFAVFVVVLLILHYFSDAASCFYHNFRQAFFSSFLTAGSFMLTLTTFFLVSLKEKFFDSEDYLKILEAKKNLDATPVNKYSPLINISTLFIFCIFLCFITSLMQITLGVLKNKFAIIICFSTVISTLCLILYTLYHVWATISVWLSLLRDKGKM